MNLPDLDSATLDILTNDEVIAVNQDPLGKPANRIKKNPEKTEIWVKELSDGSKGVGLFNRGEQSAQVTLSLQDLGLNIPCTARDLWAKNDLENLQNDYSCMLPPHGSQLLKISPKK
jgi:alpha-galactosidase